MKQVWRRDYRLIWQGQFVSQLGNYGFSALASVWAAYKTNSGPLVSSLILLPLIVQFVSGLYAGMLIDSYSRKKIFILVDLVAALLTLLLGLFFLANLHSNLAIYFAFILCSLLLAVVNSFFYPTAESIYFDLLPAEFRAKYRAMSNMSESLSRIMGPNLAILLLNLGGPALALLVDSLSFFYAALSSFFLKTKFPAMQKSTSMKPTAVWGKTKETLFFISQDRNLVTVILLAIVLNLFCFPINLLNTFLIKNTFALDMTWVGVFNTFGAFGTLTTSLYFTKVKLSQKFSFLILPVLLIALSLLFIGSRVNFYLCAFGFFVFQAALVMINLLLVTKIQERINSEQVGRVFSTLMILSNLSSPLSIFACGLLISKFNNQVSQIYTGAGIGLFTSVVVIYFLRLFILPKNPSSGKPIAE